MTTNCANHPDMMTDKELEDATAVFRSLETGLRGGTISPEDLHRAMKMLGKILQGVPNYVIVMYRVSQE